MKATQKDFPGIAPRVARSCRIFFFCGPDEAGASEAANQVIAALPDPGERVELSGADLRRDPVLLGDEARSTSLFGDSRHILVRASGDEAHDAVQTLIESAEIGGGEACPVLILAASATDKARTAKLIEKRADALVAMFWPPDLSSVSGSVRSMADAAGLRLNGDLSEQIARSAGLDVRLARSEIDKLALYLDAAPAAPKQVNPADLDAVGARIEEDGFMPLVNAVLSGQTARVPRELRRMRELSLSSVGLVLAFERRVAQLAQLAGRVGPRGNVKAIVQAEKNARRIFWKDERDLIDQVQRWHKDPDKLDRLVGRLVELHRALLAQGAAGDVILGQHLARIAREAARMR